MVCELQVVFVTRGFAVKLVFIAVKHREALSWERYKFDAYLNNNNNNEKFCCQLLHVNND